MRIASDIAHQNALLRITSITVQIGQFTGIEPEALDFAYQIMSQGTLAEGSELVIEKILLLLRCKKCAHEYNGDLENMSCPTCNAEDFTILQGREMIVKSITGEKDDQQNQD